MPLGNLDPRVQAKLVELFLCVATEVDAGNKMNKQVGRVYDQIMRSKHMLDFYGAIIDGTDKPLRNASTPAA